MKIKTTITVTFENVYSSENELPEEVQGKGINELKKFILDNKERIENELIDFTESDDVKINKIKVEEQDSERSNDKDVDTSLSDYMDKRIKEISEEE